MGVQVPLPASRLVINTSADRLAPQRRDRFPSSAPCRSSGPPPESNLVPKNEQGWFPWTRSARILSDSPLESRHESFSCQAITLTDTVLSV